MNVVIWRKKYSTYFFISKSMATFEAFLREHTNHHFQTQSQPQCRNVPLELIPIFLLHLATLVAIPYFHDRKRKSYKETDQKMGNIVCSLFFLWLNVSKWKINFFISYLIKYYILYANNTFLIRLLLRINSKYQ